MNTTKPMIHFMKKSGPRPALRIVLVMLAAGVLVLSGMFSPRSGRAADPFGGNPNKRLSIYDGTLFLDGTSSVRIGNAGRDIETSGRLYFRPNGSNRGSFVEGSPNLYGQRLELTGGLNGQHTLTATWTGTAGQGETLGTVQGRFKGALNNAVGSAVYGEVTSCGAGMTCYAGYFSGGSSQGLEARSNVAGQGATPAIKASNNDPAGLAALFDGTFSADSWRLGGNVRGTCGWAAVSGNELTCPSGRLLSGVRSSAQPDSKITDLYCCEL